MDILYRFEKHVIQYLIAPAILLQCRFNTPWTVDEQFTLLISLIFKTIFCSTFLIPNLSPEVFELPGIQHLFTCLQFWAKSWFHHVAYSDRFWKLISSNIRHIQEIIHIHLTYSYSLLAVPPPPYKSPPIVVLFFVIYSNSNV